MIKKIIVLEGIDDINKISKKDLDNEIIISFDFESHKKLKEEKIVHTLLEDYFSDDDKKLLDEKTVEFSKTWYKELDRNQQLFVNGICLGELLEMEILEYFCLILRKMIGIINIIQKEKPEKIICYSLFPFLKNICKEKKIELIGEKCEINLSLFFDMIEVPLPINKRLEVSRKRFQKLKSSFENITSTLINSKLKDFHGKYGLLLDFDLTRYEQLILEISKKHKIIMLNQRRPVVWNLQSLKIAKRLNPKILTQEQLPHETIDSKIKLEQNRIKKNLELIFSKSEFNNYFMIKENSFWSIINQNLHKIINKYFEEFVEKIYLGFNLFETLKIAYVLEWAHNGSEEQILIKIAKIKNIPVILLQHSMLPLNKKWNIYHSIYPYFPTDNVTSAVWGGIMKNYLNNNNIPDKKILELGSPQHDIYFKEDNSMNLNNSILIATNSYLHFSFAGSETNTFERLELFIKKIFANIKEKTDKKIIVKLHPGQTRSNIHKLIKSIDPNVPIYDNTDLLKLISACDAVISLNFSTIILESMMLKKPTMTILPEKQDFELEPVIKQGATLSVSELDEFDSKFDDLFNNEVREKIIHKGTNFVNDFFSNQGTASQNIARELDKFSK